MSSNFSNFLYRIPRITRYILLINIAFFVITFILKVFNIDVIEYLAVFPIQSPFFRPYQVVTHMFMHGGFAHLFFNMFALYMFGIVLENIWGEKRFLIYYFVCGIGAVAVNMLVQYFQLQHLGLEAVTAVGKEYDITFKSVADKINSDSINEILSTPTVGASGAIYGLLLAFAIYFPNAPMYIMFIPIPIKAKWLIIGFFIIELSLGIFNGSNDNIAHFAHLGGMLFGLIFIFLWKKKNNYY